MAQREGMGIAADVAAVETESVDLRSGCIKHVDQRLNLDENPVKDQVALITMAENSEVADPAVLLNLANHLFPGSKRKYRSISIDELIQLLHAKRHIAHAETRIVEEDRFLVGSGVHYLGRVVDRRSGGHLRCVDRRGGSGRLWARNE